MIGDRENKKWKVGFSKEAAEKLEDMSDKDYEEFEKIIKGFKSEKLDPTKIGQPVDWIDLVVKLKCPKCKSKDVEWLLDKNSNEVTFHCLNCKESFWMTHKEYKRAIKRNPGCVL